MSETLPDVFDHTVHIIREISDAIVGARCAVLAMHESRAERELAGMCDAHDELKKLLRQSTEMSETLGRVLQFHKGRKS